MGRLFEARYRDDGRPLVEIGRLKDIPVLHYVLINARSLVLRKFCDKYVCLNDGRDIYQIKELAFVIASPKIFKAKKVTYIYHRNWEVYEKLIEGFYDGKTREDLGFNLLQNAPHKVD